MIATLLSLGTTAEVIPRAFYNPFNEDLPVGGPAKDNITDLHGPQKSWYELKETRKALVLFAQVNNDPKTKGTALTSYETSTC